MALLFITLFNSILGLSILFPIIGPLARELGLTEFQTGLFSTAYAFMQFLMSPYWGRMSERWGRKPVLMLGILGFGVSFFLFAFVAQLRLAGVLDVGTTFWLLLLARLLGGALSSATLPTAQAYVADVTGRADRTSGMALIGAAFGLGVILGPGIGGLLAKLHLLAPVYFSAGLAFFNALFVWLALPEPKRHVHAGPLPVLRPTDPRVWPLLLTGFAISLASVAMETTVAFYFQDVLRLDAKDTAAAVATALVIYGVVAVFIQGFLVRRFKWPPRVLLDVGLPLAFFGYVLFVVSRTFAGLASALTLQGAGQGLASPGVTAGLSLAVNENEQGAVAGLNSSAQALGRMLGPIVGTGLYDAVGPQAPYVFSAALIFLVWVFLRTPRARAVLSS